MPEILRVNDKVVFVSADGSNCIIGKIEGVVDRGDKLRVDYRIVGTTQPHGNKDLNKSCIVEIPKPKEVW